MQKIKLTILCLLFLQAGCYAQTDTLVLIKQSRINYCLGKIEQVKIISDRLLIKDQEIITLNNRINNKEKEITSLNIDNKVFQEQLKIINNKNEIIEIQDQHQKIEIKQLKQKNIVLKIGLVLSIIISLVK